MSADWLNANQTMTFPYLWPMTVPVSRTTSFGLIFSDNRDIPETITDY